MANKIAIRDIERAIREAMAGSEIQFSDSTYEEKDGKMRLIIFFNKLFFTNNVVLYTKLLFEVDQNKEYLTENNSGQNFFKYLYDINCQYRMKIIDDINDFKNLWSKIIQGNDFGPNLKILSEFIKQPSFLVNEWFNKNNIKDVSLTEFKYEPKIKIMPCKSLSFHFVLTINNSDEVQLFIRKEAKNDYIYTFTINSENVTIEKSDLTSLIQTIGETLKDKFSGKSQNEAYDYENDEWIPVPKGYYLEIGEEVKVKPKTPKYYNDQSGHVIAYNPAFHMYRADFPKNVSGAILFDTNELLIKNRNRIETKNIKWYKKGKLVKEQLENGESYVGKKVRILDSSIHRHQAYDSYGGKEGDGYGVIKTYLDNTDWGLDDDYIFNIEWNNGYSDVYRLKDIEIVGDEETNKNIKWYKKGKLIKEELENGEDYEGKTVKILDSSRYRDQAYDTHYGKVGNGFGVIIEYLYDNDYDNEMDHIFRIKWNNDVNNVYRLCDIEIVDDYPKMTRWYKKGKLIKEELKSVKKYRNYR